RRRSPAPRTAAVAAAEGTHLPLLRNAPFRYTLGGPRPRRPSHASLAFVRRCPARARRRRARRARPGRRTRRTAPLPGRRRDRPRRPRQAAPLPAQGGVGERGLLLLRGHEARARPVVRRLLAFARQPRTTRAS